MKHSDSCSPDFYGTHCPRQLHKPSVLFLPALLHCQEIQFLSSNIAVGQTVDVASLPSTAVRMAIAVIGILPIAITYPFIQNNFAKGITLGAVKG